MVSLSSVLFKQLPADASCAICCENLRDTETAYRRLSSTLDLAGSPPKYVVHRSPNSKPYDGGIFHPHCFGKWAITEIVAERFVKCPHCCERVVKLDERRIEQIFADQIIEEPVIEEPDREWLELEGIIGPMDPQRGILEQVQEVLLGDWLFIDERCSLVVWAARYNRMDVIRLVIADRPISDRDRGEAVIRAAKSGHVEIVRELLAGGVLFKSFKVSALRWAIWVGSVEILQCLLAHPGPLSVIERGDLIVYAIENSRFDSARLLMADGRIESSVRQQLLVDADPERRRQIVEIFKSARVVPSVITVQLVAAVVAIAASVGIASAVYEN